jgi:hypothetical protein
MSFSGNPVPAAGGAGITGLDVAAPLNESDLATVRAA